MQRVELGSIELSRVVQGFWRLADWRMQAGELADFMQGCLDRGVTTFDTAEIYAGGEVETQMGAAFALRPELRGQVEIVSKTGISRQGSFGYYDTTFDRILRSCEESIERLNCGHIDLYLIHREDPCMDPWQTAKALQQLLDRGMVKEVGVSNFDPFKFNALNEAMGGRLVTNQIEVNPLCFEHFDSGMMDLLQQHRVRPMYWSPLAGGKLFTGRGKRERMVAGLLSRLGEKYGVEPATLAYTWLLYHPSGGLPISGSQSLDRLDAAIAALDVRLEHSDWYRIFVASGQKELR